MDSPQLQAIIQKLRSRPVPEYLSVEQSRAEMEQMAASLLPIPPDVRIEPVDAGGVPGAWVSVPGAVDDRVLFYLHGGGYGVGSIKTHTEMVSRMCRASGSRALVIDYRLAPEHPYPAAVQDSLSAYRWLVKSGVSPAHVVIGGDSAGGGLAVATLVALRDAGDPLPAAAVCLSPWVDLEALGGSMETKAELDPIIQRADLLLFAAAYLGGADPRTPLAAPLHADLKGLPPLLIQVGTAETLLDDATRIAEKARSAGVEVSLEAWDDMIHVWQIFAPLLPEGQKAIDRIGEFIREHAG